jgi:hypothetical protein
VGANLHGGEWMAGLSLWIFHKVGEVCISATLTVRRAILCEQ